MNQRNWLTVDQFCALAGKSRPTVLKWLKAERLGGFKVGGVWRIYLQEYERFKAEGLRPIQIGD